MPLKTEEIDQKGKVLFVLTKNSLLADGLKRKLTAYDYEVFVSPMLPRQIDQFQLIFIFDGQINQELFSAWLRNQPNRHLIYIFYNNQKAAWSTVRKIESNNNQFSKVINSDDTAKETVVSKILWFAFSRSSETFLNLEPTLKKKSPARPSTSFHLTLTRRHLALTVFFLLLTVELFFLIPLSFTAGLLYVSAQSLKQSRFTQSKQYLSYAAPLLTLAKTSYRPARPLLSFFYLALVPDDIIVLEEQFLLILHEATGLAENGRRFTSLLMKTDKTPTEKNETAIRLTTMKANADGLTQQLSLLVRKLDSTSLATTDLKNKVDDSLTLSQAGEQLLAYLKKTLAGPGDKRYLLLFTNNMELRPGGGFIGSFGLATFKDYTLTELTIRDVYEADGQLKGHVEPPPAIAQYLHQPHWFLRDTNFSPDFQANVEQAEWFLEKELRLKPFDGALAITTTGLTILLKAFGPVYLSDYRETITADNFYIKTQMYAEKDFFPGSIQKPTFLSSLTRALMFKLNDAPFTLTQAIKQAFDEKQMVILLRDETTATNEALVNWAGKIITPRCSSKLNVSSCLTDMLFPIDANLGVNKANFFVSRLLSLKVKIDKEGLINHTLSINFKNDSPAEVFPGGTYKNYFQVYLPKKIFLKEITKNGTLVKNYDIRETDDFTIVGMYFEVPPQKTASLILRYRLEQTALEGKNVYQLVVQKQIGAIGTDFVLTVDLPHDATITSHNLPTLAKGNRLIYNDPLSTDKIFMIAFTKE